VAGRWAVVGLSAKSGKELAMSDYVTLSCPSCGGKLEITSDIDRFACAHCGTEYIVRRGGGLISLAPVTEEIRRVRTGVDKTASELAIARLTSEIAELEEKKKKRSPEAAGHYAAAVIIGASLCCFPFVLAGGSSDRTLIISVGIAAAVVSLLVFGFLGMRADDRASAKLAGEIRQKQAEIEKHKAIVSQED
jgi:predicted RNA-binding Zn-ribbon protein involved in translation (DUF1610 family)